MTKGPSRRRPKWSRKHTGEPEVVRFGVFGQAADEGDGFSQPPQAVRSTNLPGCPTTPRLLRASRRFSSREELKSRVEPSGMTWRSVRPGSAASRSNCEGRSCPTQGRSCRLWLARTPPTNLGSSGATDDTRRRRHVLWRYICLETRPIAGARLIAH
jgi:hypothetical protein